MRRLVKRTVPAVLEPERVAMEKRLASMVPLVKMGEFLESDR